MRRALLLLLLCATGVAQDSEIEGKRHVIIESGCSQETAYVGQAVTLRLRVGFDLEFFKKHAIPLFHRQMDIQAHVSAPWLETLPDTEDLRPVKLGTHVGQEARSFAVNDRVDGAWPTERRRVEGISLKVFSLDVTVRFTSAGVRTLSAPTVRFAFATEFSEDFISERRPLDRREVVVPGKPVTIRVLDLPEEGRPEGFTGAVGRFSVTAEVDRREVEVGEIFPLVLRIRGEGNHGRFDPPSLSGLSGIHVYGRIDDRESRACTVTYDLAVVGDGVDAVPPIPFVYFEPGPSPGYRTERTKPIPLSVLRPPGGVTEGDEVVEGEERPAQWWWIVAVISLVVLCAGFLLVRYRSGNRDAVDPDEVRAQMAAEEARNALGNPTGDPAESFSTYLAARLRCAPAAVISPGLEARLIEAGVSGEPARRAADLMESLVGARYGATSPGVDRKSALTLVEELENAFGGNA